MMDVYIRHMLANGTLFIGELQVSETGVQDVWVGVLKYWNTLDMCILKDS